MSEWNFPHNNYGSEKGLETGNVETFKKDPDASLAREICQNSIDAQLDKNKPVRVEFKVFTINSNDIPGHDKLAEEIEKCYDYKKNNKKEGKLLTSIKANINKSELVCLRVSDFNTTGLIGVSDNDKTKPFYKLTRSSGSSEKGRGKGGSKGIGKYACFVASRTRAVFYSTLTSNNENGYIGIAELRSRPMLEKDPELLTQGVGYYSDNDKNFPVQGELELDSNFKRTESGTDIYIIGYDNSGSWKIDIITKVLESFMVAVQKGVLEVLVDDILICKDTIYELLYEKDILKERSKIERRGILAQYELLIGDVDKEEIPIGESSKIIVYVKRYANKNKDDATKQCVMVRYPYMKIKHTTGHSFLPYSALCIIENNLLNEKLVSIENPEHTEWYLKSIQDDPVEKGLVKGLKNEMENKIDEYIKKVLKQSDSESTDIDGAGDYLPSMDNSNDGSSEDTVPVETTVTTKPKKNNSESKKTNKRNRTKNDSENNEEEQAEEIDVFLTPDQDSQELMEVASGGEGPGGGFGIHPGPGPGPGPGPHPGPHPGIIGGEDTSLAVPVSESPEGELKQRSKKKVGLIGGKFINIVVDKNKGEFNLVFKSKFTTKEGELALQMFGAGSDKYPINILSAKINGVACEVKDGRIVNLQVNRDKAYTISYLTDVKKLFSCEVSLYDYR